MYHTSYFTLQLNYLYQSIHQLLLFDFIGLFLQHIWLFQQNSQLVINVCFFQIQYIYVYWIFNWRLWSWSFLAKLWNKLYKVFLQDGKLCNNFTNGLAGTFGLWVNSMLDWVLINARFLGASSLVSKKVSRGFRCINDVLGVGTGSLFVLH